MFLSAWSPGIAAPVLATAVGVLACVLGLWLTGLRRRARLVVPLSAGVLLGVVVFGLMPELTVEIGWGASIALAAAGYCLLLTINRYAYHVFPACPHAPHPNSCHPGLP